MTFPNIESIMLFVKLFRHIKIKVSLLLQRNKRNLFSSNFNFHIKKIRVSSL